MVDTMLLLSVLVCLLTKMVPILTRSMVKIDKQNNQCHSRRTFMGIILQNNNKVNFRQQTHVSYKGCNCVKTGQGEIIFVLLHSTKPYGSHNPIFFHVKLRPTMNLNSLQKTVHLLYQALAVHTIQIFSCQTPPKNESEVYTENCASLYVSVFELCRKGTQRDRRTDRMALLI